MTNSKFCFALVTTVVLIGSNAQAVVKLHQITSEEASYQVHFFKRRKIGSRPFVLGSIYDSQSGKGLPGPAMAVLNNVQVLTDATGHYQREVTPGVYTIIGRSIFYRNLSVSNLKVATGDSIIINFYLQGESTTN
ncbi:MAG: carboxypeptidase-like regulatory domain-containing protein [Janthinobacterium lividum]